MLHYIDHKKMGKGAHGWLESHFHFSFAEYHNPQNIRFGILRVLNDDTVQPGTGFSAHPHQDMEIISYVICGELSHEDNMGNARTLIRGQAQYMSAGTGVIHSEFNHGNTELRFMQMWIFPDQKGYAPNYGDYGFIWEDRINKWLPLACGYNNIQSTAPIHIHADVNVYAAIISAGRSLDFKLLPN
ncbi:MAG: pirin family protein, partial [Firmicutes bacterium]|nr:pirin family protein [Bacillota bacterium]